MTPATLVNGQDERADARRWQVHLPLLMDNQGATAENAAAPFHGWQTVRSSLSDVV